MKRLTAYLARFCPTNSWIGNCINFLAVVGAIATLWQGTFYSYLYALGLGFGCGVLLVMDGVSALLKRAIADDRRWNAARQRAVDQLDRLEEWTQNWLRRN